MRSPSQQLFAQDPCPYRNPTVTEQFAAGHGRAMARCLSKLLGSDELLPLDALQRARLPLQLGGLGLRPALAASGAAYWASWADTLPILRDRVPRLVSAARSDVTAGAAGPVVRAVAELMHAAVRLRDAGYAAPGWDELIAGGSAAARAFSASPWGTFACHPLLG